MNVYIFTSNDPIRYSANSACVPVACQALFSLSVPVCPIIREPSAFPTWVSFPRIVFRKPLPITEFVTKCLTLFKTIFLNINLFATISALDLRPSKVMLTFLRTKMVGVPFAKNPRSHQRNTAVATNNLFLAVSRMTFPCSLFQKIAVIFPFAFDRTNYFCIYLVIPRLEFSTTDNTFFYNRCSSALIKLVNTCAGTRAINLVLSFYWSATALAVWQIIHSILQKVNPAGGRCWCLGNTRLAFGVHDLKKTKTAWRAMLPRRFYFITKIRLLSGLEYLRLFWRRKEFYLSNQFHADKYTTDFNILKGKGGMPHSSVA